MNVYKSKRLEFVPMGDYQHEGFFKDLMSRASTLNFDTSLPTGFSTDNAQSAIKSLKDRKLLSMYVCVSSWPRDPVPIGVISLSKPEDRNAQHGSTKLSLTIAGGYQRQGYGTEALAWALDWAFDFARLHRVELTVFGWNPGARRFYSRVGFREEGVKREAIWFMGAWHDFYEMAILEHEWRGKWRAEVQAKTWAPEDGKSYSDEQIAEKMGST
ncbi:acyl-CoA N-acyltransferase [Nemania sp. FL0916]|nr:acyl-CoA N-acyltransferase [Nemania sp. FL0916]